MKTAKAEAVDRARVRLADAELEIRRLRAGLARVVETLTPAGDHARRCGTALAVAQLVLEVQNRWSGS